MAKLAIAPRIRGFICLNAHPAGCAANVDREIAVATDGAPGKGMAHALLGSVAERVVQHAPCPVLIVPKRATT